jgi:hypothetical protein
VHGVWEVIAISLLNDSISARRSAPRESRVKSLECSPSATYAREPSRAKSTEFLQHFTAMHSGLLIEITKSPRQFGVDRAFRGAVRFGVLR